jgi:hypothetical protein
MQKVIDHLHNHQADCRILFYSDGKQLQGEGDCPSGKDKVSVCAVIAKYVFEDDDEYRDYYKAAPDKFRDSTNNHINGYVLLMHLLHYVLTFYSKALEKSIASVMIGYMQLAQVSCPRMKVLRRIYMVCISFYLSQPY